MRTTDARSHSNSAPKGLALAAVISLASLAGAQSATNWVAYNDYVPGPPPDPMVNNGWGTAPNVTVYNLRGIAGTPPQPTEGPLTDYLTGEQLPAYLIVTANGAPDYFGGISYPDLDTPAYNLFYGLVDLGNPNSAIGIRHQGGNVPNTSTTLTFTNLDPGRRYVFRGTTVRGNNYLGRWTVWTIMGATAFTDAHSAAVYTKDSFPSGTMTNGQASWNSGENRADGAVVGWDDIAPSSEGTFSILNEQYVDDPLPNGQPPTLSNYGYAISGFMLAEVGETTPVGISVQPAAQIAVERFRALDISVTTTGSAPAYQWYKDGTAVDGATRRTYSVKNAALSDSGDYFVVVTNVLNSVTSTVAHVTVYNDTNPPALVRVIATTANSIVVYYNEQMDPGTATDGFLSSVDQGVGIRDGVTNASNPLRIDFPLDPGTPTLGTIYTFTAGTAVTDLSGNPIDPNRRSVQFRAQNYDGNPDTLRTVPTTGVLPIGSLTERGFDLRVIQIATNKIAPALLNDLVLVEALLAGTRIDPATGEPYQNIALSPCTIEPGVINYNKDAPSPVANGHLGATLPFPGIEVLQPGNVVEGMAFEALSYVELRSGAYRWGVNSDDGFRVAVATSAFDPNRFVLGDFNGGRAAADSTFDFYIAQDGLYPVRLIYEEGAGGANVEFWNVDLNVSTSTYVGINDPSGLPAYRPPRPSLSLTLSGANAVICWPAAASPYCLQASANLATWADVTTPVNRGPGGNCVTVPHAAQQFYRLILK